MEMGVTQCYTPTSDHHEKSIYQCYSRLQAVLD
jgi:hypothetical protein